MDGKMTPQQEAILNNEVENSIEAWTVLKEIDAEMQKSVPDVLPVEDQLRHLKAAETSHDRTIRLRHALVTGNEHEQDNPVVKKLLAHLADRIVWENETLRFWRSVLKS